MPLRSTLIKSLLCIQIATLSAHAESIPVRFPEGSIHGFLSLRTQDGKLVAAGDLTQTVRGAKLVSKLTYRFKDGSVDEETTVSTQNGHFSLISDRRVQTGPMFPKPLDMTIEARSGQVTVRSGEKGSEKVETSHMDLPDDLSNGILMNVLKNISPKAAETRLPYLVATPKPRLVHLSVKPDGSQTYRVAGRASRATRYVIHVDLGGVVGLLAPIVGKEPPDSHAWISGGDVPTLVRSETPLYLGGPVLRTEINAPVWGDAPAPTLKK